MPEAAAPPTWWPHVERSTFVAAAGLRWHLQRWPRRGAPVALLLHGTGAATHSWRHLAPLLRQAGFEVIAPDLPGHAFTETPAMQRLTLPAVAQALGGLLEALQLEPDLVVGHSAGAAIALRMALDRVVAPRLIVSINGAMLPLQGPVGRLFLPIARVLAANPLVAPLFAAWAGLPSVTRRLIDSTGSRIDADGERAYAHLVTTASHAAGALRLMASWDLHPLAEALGGAALPPLLLIAGQNDRTLPAQHSQRVAERLGDGASVAILPGLGHLAHEERAPAVLAALMSTWGALSAA